MRVVNQQVPTPFRDIDARHAAAPERARVRAQGRRAAVPRGSACCDARAASSAQISVDGPRARRSPRGCPSGLYSGARRSSTTCATCSSDPGPHRRLPRARRPSCTSPRPTSTRCERIVFGADGWDDVPISTRGARLDRAADGLQAGPRRRPRADRRRHRLDDEPRHRRRGRREARRRRQPAGAVRQRLLERDRDASPARAPGASATWASRRSATRRSSCWPTSACTRWRDAVEDRYPDVDIILIEPEPNDELMFQTSIMNFTSARRHRPPRLPVGDAEARLRVRRPASEICARHGIEISPTRVRKVVKHFARREGDRPAPGARSSSRRPARCCASRSEGGA